MTKLQAERLRHGWTQVALSYHSGVQVSEISRLEAGRIARPYPGQAARLASALGLRSEELLEPVVASEAVAAIEARGA